MTERGNERRTGISGIALALLLGLSACASPPRQPDEPIEKSVLSIEGVKHGPILVAPDSVVAGGIIEGTVHSQTPSVLVQAVVEESREPIGSQPLSGAESRPRTFTFRVPRDTAGTILVRAIDKNMLYTDKVISVVAPEGSGS